MTKDNRLSVLVLTCDAYSDLWNDFFTLKERFWQDCPFNTYLVTEAKGYEREGVQVLNCGDINWSGRLKQSLKCINTPLVLTIMDDYFISKTVDNKVIDENVDFCIKKDVSFMSLEKKSILNDPNRQYFEKYVIIPKHGRYSVDTAAAIWNKDYLFNILGDEDYSAWQFEINMCEKAKTENGIDGLILCDERKPLNVTEVPIVIQGKFYPLGIKYFKSIGYTIDTSRRKQMSRREVLKYKFKLKMAGIKYGRKFIKLIASRLFGYKFFTKD